MFEKKNLLISELNAKIASLREFKKFRTDVNEKIEKIKKVIDAVNSERKPFVDERRKIIRERKEIMKKEGISYTPGEIEKKIEKLEFYIETTPLKENKEKEIRKEIKSLYNMLKKTEEIKTLIAKEKELKAKIKEYDMKINVNRNIIRQLIFEIKGKRKSVDGYGKRLDKIRTEIEDLNAALVEYKKELNEEKSKLPKKDSKSKKDKVRKEEKNYSEKDLTDNEKKIIDKMNNGEKLTNDDLRIYQMILMKLKK